MSVALRRAVEKRNRRFRVPSPQQVKLLRVLLDGQNSHGYPIMKETGLSQATLYGLLKRLHGDGYLAKSSQIVNGRCRIHYSLTEAGVRYAERALIEDEYERAVSGPSLETP